MSGRPRLRYEVDTVLRYQCREGLAQRNLPLIRCQENGRWERPQISCVPRRPVSARGGATSLVLPVTGCVTLKVSLRSLGPREGGGPDTLRTPRR